MILSSLTSYAFFLFWYVFFCNCLHVHIISHHGFDLRGRVPIGTFAGCARIMHRWILSNGNIPLRRWSNSQWFRGWHSVPVGADARCARLVHGRELSNLDIPLWIRRYSSLRSGIPICALTSNVRRWRWRILIDGYIPRWHNLWTAMEFGDLSANAFIFFDDSLFGYCLQVDVVYFLSRKFRRWHWSLESWDDHRFSFFFLSHVTQRWCMQLDVFVNDKRTVRFVVRCLWESRDTHAHFRFVFSNWNVRNGGFHNNFTDGSRIRHFGVNTGQRSWRARCFTFQLCILYVRIAMNMRCWIQVGIWLHLSIDCRHWHIITPFFAFQNRSQSTFLGHHQIGVTFLWSNRRRSRTGTLLIFDAESDVHVRFDAWSHHWSTEYIDIDGCMSIRIHTGQPVKFRFRVPEVRYRTTNHNDFISILHRANRTRLAQAADIDSFNFWRTARFGWIVTRQRLWNVGRSRYNQLLLRSRVAEFHSGNLHANKHWQLYGGFWHFRYARSGSRWQQTLTADQLNVALLQTEVGASHAEEHESQKQKTTDDKKNLCSSKSFRFYRCQHRFNGYRSVKHMWLRNHSTNL